MSGQMRAAPRAEEPGGGGAAFCFLPLAPPQAASLGRHDGQRRIQALGGVRACSGRGHNTAVSIAPTASVVIAGLVSTARRRWQCRKLLGRRRSLRVACRNASLEDPAAQQRSGYSLEGQLPWARGTVYSQASILIPEGCTDGAVCLPDSPCNPVAMFMDESLTKMICTLGPASSSVEVIRKLIEAGMDVARLNFSHGDHESQLKLLNTVREAAAGTSETDYRPVATMLDTKGPEIRTGRTKEKGGKVMFTMGSEITLTNDYALFTDSHLLPLSYADFIHKVRVGQAIRIGDGKLNLEVTNIDEAKSGCVQAKVLNDAEIGDRKNCNIPGIRVELPLLQEKDKYDLLEFAIPQHIDFIALSFVQDAVSVLQVRKMLEEHCPKGQPVPLLISKIENGEGLKNFDEILGASDGIMVARGDLGMEIPPEQVFMAQKVMIGRCNLIGKFVITATQMLESMTSSPRPTRAEASDVANAVLDGSDCVMLSGETAAGLFPVEAARIMGKICLEAERSTDHLQVYSRISQSLEGLRKSPNEGVCHAAVKLANECKVAAILALTQSGYTARQIAKYKPGQVIIAATPFDATRRRLAVVRGVVTLKSSGELEGATTPVIEAALSQAKELGLLVEGDSVVVVHGSSPGSGMRDHGFSNLVKVVPVE